MKIRLCQGMIIALACLSLSAFAGAQNLEEHASFDPYPVDPASRKELESKIEQHLQSIQHRILRGDYAAALSEINEALSLAPDHPMLLQYAGHVHAARGAYILAEDCWNRLCKMDPENGFYQTGLAGMYIREGNPKRAIPLLEAALQRDPTHLPARFNMALVRMTEGKPEKAEKLLRARNSTETGQLASWIAEENQTIFILLGRNGFDVLAAIVLEGKRPENDSKNRFLTPEKLQLAAEPIYRAFRSAEEENWPSAIAALNQARLAGAKAPAVYQDLALYAWMNGSREKARALLQSLTTRFPDQPSISATLGILSLKDGLELEAIRHLKKAVASDPLNAEALFGLACTYAKAEETTKARMLLARLQRLMQKHPSMIIRIDQDYSRYLRDNENSNRLLEQIESTIGNKSRD